MKAIIFQLKKPNKDGEHGIYIRIRISRKKNEFSLKFAVKPEFWDNEKLRVKSKHPYAKKYNLIIENKLQKANDIFLDHKINQKDLSIDEFEFLYIKVLNKDSFYEFAEHYIKDKGYEGETLRSYQSYLTKLKHYKKDINFSEINTLAFSEAYEKYMRTKLLNESSTTHKSLSFIRTVLNDAKSKGILQQVLFNFDVKKKSGTREFLTSQELEQLENLINDKRLKGYQEKALTYFLFACYSGLRYMDLKTLKYNEIVIKEVYNDTTKQLEPIEHIKKLIHKTKNSTGLVIEIPLISRAKKLIGIGLPEELIFAVNSNQVSNRYAKELMVLAKIKKNISMHCARHTFATHCLNLGIPMEVVSKLLGHSDLRTTQIYAKIVDSSKVKGMDKWEK